MVSVEAPRHPSLPQNTSWSTLLQLEGMVRAAQNRQELQFLFVNETRRLVSYRQAILLIPPTIASPKYEVRAASSVPIVDRTVPLIQWIECLVGDLRRASTSQDICHVVEADCPAEFKSDWKEFTAGHGLW